MAPPPLPPRARIRLLATALAVGVALAGCTSADPASVRVDPSPHTTSTTDPTFALSPQEVVLALASDEDDLAEGEESTIVAQGDPEYEQEPSTLGYCSYQLIIEGSRYQRLEVQITRGKQTEASIDAALYTPGRAATALRELRSGEERCPADRPVPPLQWESATEPSTWSAEPLPDADTATLAEDHWARTVTRTPAGGPPEVATVIAQRRGDALVVVTAADPARARALAGTAAARLAATDSYLIQE